MRFDFFNLQEQYSPGRLFHHHREVPLAGEPPDSRQKGFLRHLRLVFVAFDIISPQSVEFISNFDPFLLLKLNWCAYTMHSAAFPYYFLSWLHQAEAELNRFGTTGGGRRRRRRRNYLCGNWRCVCSWFFSGGRKKKRRRRALRKCTDSASSSSSPFPFVSFET